MKIALILLGIIFFWFFVLNALGSPYECWAEADCNHYGEYKIYRPATSFFGSPSVFYGKTYTEKDGCVTTDKQETVCGQYEITRIRER